MAPLKFCANISWLFTELPDFSQRIYAAASAGFKAVEAAWLYDSELQELQKAREATGVEVVLINTPPGDVKAGELGLGAVPGREAEFRQGLDLAVKYAKALDCKRIHLMAGRVPDGSHRTAVAKEMEAIFVQNLNYAADVLSKSCMVVELKDELVGCRRGLDPASKLPTVEQRRRDLRVWRSLCVCKFCFSLVSTFLHEKGSCFCIVFLFRASASPFHICKHIFLTFHNF
ncbi:putative hydroxypyruvate isomerase isoform X2 [Trachinotus anak]|uniref:putative hydroxypyruvate isomerase isoform X2 n=1 Tax=Trachinotus anak TaxID=443729 RepID=UPI0039F19BE3